MNQEHLLEHSMFRYRAADQTRGKGRPEKTFLGPPLAPVLESTSPRQLSPRQPWSLVGPSADEGAALSHGQCEDSPVKRELRQSLYEASLSQRSGDDTLTE